MRSLLLRALLRCLVRDKSAANDGNTVVICLTGPGVTLLSALPDSCITKKYLAYPPPFRVEL